MFDHTEVAPAFDATDRPRLRSALVGPPEWRVHRILPGYGGSNVTPTLTLARAWERVRDSRAGAPDPAMEVVWTNLLPDRTVRMWLTHPDSATDHGITSGADTVTSARVVTYDPAFGDDVAVAVDHLRPSDPGAPAPALAALDATRVGWVGHPIDVVALGRHLAAADVPASLRLRLETPNAAGDSDASIRLGGLRSRIGDAVTGSPGRGPDAVAVGCRATALTLDGDRPAIQGRLQEALGTVLATPRPTAADPEAPPSTHRLDDVHTPFPSVDLGTAADWHAAALRGTTSTRPAPTNPVDEILDTSGGLPLGPPIDHAGRPGPTTLHLPTDPAPTIARYTIHHRDHDGLLSDYRALVEREGPTIVLDGTGTLAEEVAATHRQLAPGHGDMTPLLGQAPSALSAAEYRSLCTHTEGTLLVDPTDCADPPAVGDRLVTALCRVTANLPDHRPTVLVSAPTSVLSYGRFRGLLAAANTRDVAVACRLPVPHRQCVFGPDGVSRVRRAWYRLASDHAAVTLVTRLPSTIDPAPVGALAPPTADPQRIADRATGLGPDHWLVHVRCPDGGFRAADEASGLPERATSGDEPAVHTATFAVHTPTPPPGLEALPGHRARRLRRWLERHREESVTPTIDRTVDERPPASHRVDDEDAQAAGFQSLIPDPTDASDSADTNAVAGGEAPARSGDTPGPAPTGTTDPSTGDAAARSPSTEASPAADGSVDPSTAASGGTRGAVPVTTLPYTQRFPDCLVYDADAHLVACGACGTRYAAAIEGIERGIACCHDHATVDREDVPTVDAPLKLTADERAAIAYSDSQLVFLKLVNDARLGRYDPDLEYDITRDSMTLLRAYAGVDREGVKQLVADGLLNDNGTHPHQLYTITHEGRELINEGRRHGVDVGDGLGDLSESSQHVLMVDLLARHVAREYVDDADSAASEVHTYYERDDVRFDVAALDADGELVVTGEAERPTNDVAESAPADYDKMAACDPEAAIWVVPGHADGHTAVLDPLADPADGDPRVEKTYSEHTRMQEINLDRPGITEIYTISMLSRRLDS